MWNIYPPPFYPYPPTDKNSESPWKVLREFERFMRKREGKDKDKHKGNFNWQQINSISTLLLIGMCAGPVWILMMSVILKMLKASLP